MDYIPPGGEYKETTRAKVSLTTGLAWRKVDEDTIEPLGLITNVDDWPDDLIDDLEFLLWEHQDAVDCARAYERTVNASYYRRLSAPCWN